jgi:hypothetical protein
LRSGAWTSGAHDRPPKRARSSFIKSPLATK